MTRYDVVTLGETMIRLTPPHFQRIEQATALEMEAGGTESNTAVGLARLGVKTAWLSRLPDTPLGRWVANVLTGYGVDTSHVVWTDEDRMGLFFLERGTRPRNMRVFYDRAGSAVSRITPADLPEDLFQEGNSRLLHLTGITVAISPSAAETAARACKLARQAGWAISFDLNYRSKLWTLEEARAGCHPFIQAADLIFLPWRDAVAVFAMPPDASPEDACRTLSDQYPRATIIMTLGAEGAIGYPPDGRPPLRQSAFPADEIGRIGAGDAFTAGFLCAYLETADLATALRWGTAAAALKYTIPGDMPIIERAEIEQILATADLSARVSR